LRNTRNYLIIGSGTSLGYALAKSVIANSKVVLVSRNDAAIEGLTREYPTSSLAIKSDLSSIGDVEKIFNKTKDFYEKPDVIFYNIGGGLGLRSELINYDDLKKLLWLNIGLITEFNNRFIPIMNNGGNIVCVGSVASSEAIASVGYSVAKASLAAYVRVLGNSMAKKSIVITGLLPGGFESPGNAMDRLKKNNYTEYMKYIDQKLPRGVMGDLAEIMPLLEFLCSEKAGMMSGCMVPIDAGEGKAFLL